MALFAVRVRNRNVIQASLDADQMVPPSTGLDENAVYMDLRYRPLAVKKGLDELGEVADSRTANPADSSKIS